MLRPWKQKRTHYYSNYICLFLREAFKRVSGNKWMKTMCCSIIKFKYDSLLFAPAYFLCPEESESTVDVIILHYKCTVRNCSIALFKMQSENETIFLLGWYACLFEQVELQSTWNLVGIEPWEHWWWLIISSLENESRKQVADLRANKG